MTSADFKIAIGFNFSTCIRISWDKRENVVRGLVDILRNEVPTLDLDIAFFDPVLLISYALKAE